MLARRIGIIGYNGVTALNLVAPIECFTSAFYLDGQKNQKACYEIVVVAAESKQFTTDSGLKFTADVILGEHDQIDTLLIPGGTTLRSGDLGERIADWLQLNVERFRRVVSICTGIYALAPTGLLDRRRVTTHWRFANEIAQRFPLLRMEAREIFIKDGKFYTSGGATAGIDLSLALIEEDFGPEVALSVARTMLAYRQREGDQEQYVEPPRLDTSDAEKLGALAFLLEQNLGSPLSLSDLVDRTGLSANEINKRFKQSLGTTPAAFIKRLRLNESRRRLGLGEKVKDVARFLRFGGLYYFEREFRWQFGISPEEYRSRRAAALSISLRLAFSRAI